MDEVMTVDLQDELIADLTSELSGEDSFNSSALTQKVINAIREVKNARKYPSNYTDDMIRKDIYRHYSIIRGIALYDYNKIGVEGQVSHSENGTSRTWEERKSLFNGVLPLSRF